MVESQNSTASISSFEWELIHKDYTQLECTYRAKVLGGWLVRYVTKRHNCQDVAMVFIKDITHEWKL